MALMKLSGLLSGLKGKINGSYAQARGNGLYGLNLNGQYAAKKKPKRMMNADAKKLQVAYSNLAQQWRTLSDTERTQWGSACINYPTTDRFGAPRTPTAYELYMRLNGTLSRYNLGYINTPLAPATFSTIGPMGISEASATAFKFDPNGTITAGEYIILCACPWQSAGKQVDLTQMRIIAQYDSSAVYPVDPYPNYAAIFNQPPTGVRLWFGMYIVNSYTGQRDTMQVNYIDYTI